MGDCQNTSSCLPIFVKFLHKSWGAKGSPLCSPLCSAPRSLPARIPIYDRTRSSVCILCISVAALRFAAAIASCSSLSNHPLPSQSNRSKSLCSRKKSSYRSKVHLGLGRCAAWRVIGACAAGGRAGPRAVYPMAGPHIGEQHRAPNLHTGGHLANWERQLT